MLDRVLSPAASIGQADEPTGRRKLRVALITENEPFFMAEAVERLLTRLPEDIEVVQAIVMNYGHGQQSVSTEVDYRAATRVFGVKVLLQALLLYFTGRLRPANRVAARFRKFGVPVNMNVRDINARETLDFIAGRDVDVVASIGFNRLFRKPFRSLPRLGCINVHSGIHPDHRGKAGVFWALADGHDETGVTVHTVDGSVDGGRVILQRRHEISSRSFTTLLGELRMIGMEALADALKSIRDGNLERCAVPQEAAGPCRPVPTERDLERFRDAGNRIF